jgi:hypothetical protein
MDIEPTMRSYAAGLQSFRRRIAHSQLLAIRRSPLLPSTSKCDSSKRVRNSLKINGDAASYPQLKQGVRRDDFPREFQWQVRKYSTESPQFFPLARGQR